MAFQTSSIRLVDIDYDIVVGHVRLSLGLSRVVVDDYRVPLPEMHALTFVYCEEPYDGTSANFANHSCDHRGCSLN